MSSPNQVMAQLPTATNMTELEEETVPSILLPCSSCKRTFRPEALNKHSKYCEKSLIKKRKVFDSAKQRIQGTELAAYLPILTRKKRSEKSPIRKSQSKWKEKHLELVRTIRAARSGPSEHVSPPLSKPCDHEKCPHCDRYFGPKAYDRHLEWCKEQCSRKLQKSPACIQAKERLDARTKYRAPVLSKSRRSVVQEMTQLDENHNKCSSPIEINQKGFPHQSRKISSVEKLQKTDNSFSNATKQPAGSPKGELSTADESCTLQPIRRSKITPSPARRTSAKNRNRCFSEGNGDNILSRKDNTGGTVTHCENTSTPEENSNNLAEPIEDIFSVACNITSIQPKPSPRLKLKDRSICQQTLTPGHHHSIPLTTPAEGCDSGSKRRYIRKSREPILNGINVNDNIMGMTVYPCRPATCDGKCCNNQSNSSFNSDLKAITREDTTLSENIPLSSTFVISTDTCKYLNNEDTNQGHIFKKPPNSTTDFSVNNILLIDGKENFNDILDDNSLCNQNKDYYAKSEHEIRIDTEKKEANFKEINFYDKWDSLEVDSSKSYEMDSEKDYVNIPDSELNIHIFNQPDQFKRGNTSNAAYDVETIESFENSDDDKYNLMNGNISKTGSKSDIKYIMCTDTKDDTEYHEVDNIFEINSEANEVNCNHHPPSVKNAEFYSCDSLNEDCEEKVIDGSMKAFSDDLNNPIVKKRKYDSSFDLSRSAEVIFMSSPLQGESSVSYSYKFSEQGFSSDDCNFKKESSSIPGEEDEKFCTLNAMFTDLNMKLCEDCHRSRSDSDLCSLYNKELLKCCLHKKNRMLKVKQACLGVYNDETSVDLNSSIESSDLEELENKSEIKEQYFETSEPNQSEEIKTQATECSDYETDYNNIDRKVNRSMTFLIPDETTYCSDNLTHHPNCPTAGNNTFEMDYVEDKNFITHEINQLSSVQTNTVDTVFKFGSIDNKYCVTSCEINDTYSDKPTGNTVFKCAVENTNSITPSETNEVFFGNCTNNLIKPLVTKKSCNLNNTEMFQSSDVIAYKTEGKISMSDLDTYNSNRECIAGCNQKDFPFQFDKNKELNADRTACVGKQLSHKNEDFSEGNNIYCSCHDRNHEQLVYRDESAGDWENLLFEKNLDCEKNESIRNGGKITNTLFLFISESEIQLNNEETVIPKEKINPNEKSSKKSEIVNKIYSKNDKHSPDLDPNKHCNLIGPNIMLTDFTNNYHSNNLGNKTTDTDTDTKYDLSDQFYCASSINIDNIEYDTSESTYIEHYEHTMTEECYVSYTSEVNRIKTWTWQDICENFKDQKMLDSPSKSFLPPIKTHSKKHFFNSSLSGKIKNSNGELNPNQSYNSTKKMKKSESKIPKLTNWQQEAEKYTGLPSITSDLPNLKKNFKKRKMQEPFKLPQLTLKGISQPSTSFHQGFNNQGLNSKSPQLEECATTENSKSSGSKHSFPPVESQNSQFARFCHECGAKYPVVVAKFCCQCGVKRLVI